MKERMEVALMELNNTLRKELVESKLLPIEQWNSKIAPRLCEMGMSIEGVYITARTYKLPDNYFE